MNFTFRPHPIPTIGMVVMVGILIALGTWQMTRFFEKSEREEEWSKRRSAPPVEVESVDALASPEMEHTVVSLRGEMAPERLAVFRYQRWAGQPGCWIASPLELPAGGGTVLAVRGFVPILRTGGCDVEGAAFEPAETWSALVHTPRPLVDAEGRRTQEPPVTTWAGFDVEGAYEALEIEDAPQTATVVILDERHSATPYPAASFEHVTDPYLTSMRHLNYAGTWYVLVFVVLGLWGWVSLEKTAEHRD